MLTRDEIDILLTSESRQAIDDNIDRNPVTVAMDKRLAHPRLISTQVKYLQRARTKLPSYYAARCIMAPLAFEQSSAEAVSCMRWYSGKLAIDLTCGLGMDAYALSKKFEQVIAIEKDPVLAYLAKVNFELLGSVNIEVVNCAAEDFISGNSDMRPDLIFADPDRRSASGRKLVLMEDCSPDIPALMPALRAISTNIAVKLSPLFDVNEVLRVLGEHTTAEVVSLSGECKEVVAHMSNCSSTHEVMATVSGYGSIKYSVDGNGAAPSVENPGLFRYMVVPDVAMEKAGIARRWFGQNGFHIDNDHSFAFRDEMPANVPGKIYIIKSVFPYSPRKLKKQLAEKGIKSINIIRRGFPVPAEKLAAELGIKPGGDLYMAFIRSGGNSWAILAQRIE